MLGNTSQSINSNKRVFKPMVFHIAPKLNHRKQIDRELLEGNWTVLKQGIHLQQLNGLKDTPEWCALLFYIQSKNLQIWFSRTPNFHVFEASDVRKKHPISAKCLKSTQNKTVSGRISNLEQMNLIKISLSNYAKYFPKRLFYLYQFFEASDDSKEHFNPI